VNEITSSPVIYVRILVSAAFLSGLKGEPEAEQRADNPRQRRIALTGWAQRTKCDIRRLYSSPKRSGSERGRARMNEELERQQFERWIRSDEFFEERWLRRDSFRGYRYHLVENRWKAWLARSKLTP